MASSDCAPRRSFADILEEILNDSDSNFDYSSESDDEGTFLL